LTMLPAGGTADAPRVPDSPRREVRETLHGVEIVDPYRWLEDQESKETRAWIDAQNRYTDSFLKKQPSRPAIARRLGRLVRVESRGVPIARGGRYFYTKRGPKD